MASQPNLPTPHQTNYMDMPVPLLQQVQSIITPPHTDAATSHQISSGSTLSLLTQKGLS